MKKFLCVILLLKASAVIAADSNVEREDKKFMVTASIFEFLHRTSGISLEAGHYLTADEIVSIKTTLLTQAGNSYTIGDEDSDSNESKELWDEAGKGFAISANYKRFVSSTFYLKPSLYYRSQNLVISTSSVAGELTDSEAGHVYDAGVGFTLGNQWQWSKFTLGCDWVGYNHSLALLDSRGNLEEDSYNNGLTLLNFYVGASF